MKIYTRTGDDGETGLFRGPRVAKDHPRIEAYGTVDELNAVLGVVRADEPPSEIDAALVKIQRELFSLGADLATPEAGENPRHIAEEQVRRLEAEIDRFEADLAKLRQFILPGGTKVAAGLHFARTVCRRAERRVVTLGQVGEPLPEAATIYLNRLSDLLFLLARAANATVGVDEETWEPG